MSWFWLLFFLILSGMAVGAPLFLMRAPEAAPAETLLDRPASRRQRIDEALRELDVDLGAGKVTAQEHAAARSVLLAELDTGGAPE